MNATVAADREWPRFNTLFGAHLAPPLLFNKVRPMNTGVVESDRGRNRISNLAPLRSSGGGVAFSQCEEPLR